MNKRHISSWLTFVATCLSTVVLIASCASTDYQPTEAPPEPTPTSESQLEEILVTGQRSDTAGAARSANGDVIGERMHRRSMSMAGVDSNALAAARNTLTATGRGGAGLSAAQPGEELWIIAKPPADVGDRDDGDYPRSGAMLASVQYPGEQSDSPPVQIPLPLKHTSVRAAVNGYVGTVDVTQQFENPFDEKIEAVYLFPLPQNAAVSEFVMAIGDRKIRGILREKAEAEEIYRQARAQGYRASLLVQHRPNIFEQKVANIEPGKSIDVEIRYFHTLAFSDGWYSFVFPTVVGPRYNPPGGDDPVHAWSRDRYKQPADGTAIRYLRPKERSAHDISIEVDINAGVKIENVRSSHEIQETPAGPNSTRVILANQSTMPNRDFILSFQVAGETMKSGLLTYVDSKTSQGYFTLMMYPPAGLQELARQPMEMVFVLDCSGSMNGKPLAQSKAAVVAALDQLRGSDTFQIIRFSSSASRFGTEPVPATRANIQVAKAYVQQLNGSGGTQMIEGIKAALGFPHDARRLRFVTFLTDGYIGNETEIIGEIHERIGESRIFSFGVGSSVNRYLLERMATMGHGAVAYLGLDDSGEKIMTDFFDRISHPVLTDVDIDWGQMRTSDIYPAELPDMFVGRPVVVTGKYEGSIAEPVIIGKTGATERRSILPKADDSAVNSFIPKIWARLRIADLSDRQTWTRDPDELGIEIKATALEHGLMSRYTSFVAVDASEATAGSQGTTVYQAVPVPKGVKYETTVEKN